MDFLNSLHKTLRRQIRTNLGENFQIPLEWQNFVKTISDAYIHFDEDRILSERAMELSSKELMVISKKATDEAVILQATLNATTDGILIMDNNYKIVSYNKRYQDLWKVPEEVMALRDVIALITYESGFFNEPEVFVSKSKENYAKIDSDCFDILQFKDGRIYERHSQPLKVRGAYSGRVFGYRDVTTQKHYEIQLKGHNEDLEKMNNLMINRELKMIELKKEIMDLRKQAQPLVNNG